MKIILFGATGMVGSGVLREALVDPDISEILCVGRRPCGITHTKIKDLIIPDLFQFSAFEKELIGYDGCVWALGISSIGKDEAEYRKITEELTMLWAMALLRLNPIFSFSYCSAQGAGGSAMWARVRQSIEKFLRALPFKNVGVVRPGLIQPGKGIKSGVKIYQAAIVMFRPLFPILVRLFPRFATTSDRLGRAMLRIVQGRARHLYILESSDINRVGY